MITIVSFNAFLMTIFISMCRSEYSIIEIIFTSRMLSAQIDHAIIVDIVTEINTVILVSIVHYYFE